MRCLRSLALAVFGLLAVASAHALTSAQRAAVVLSKPPARPGTPIGLTITSGQMVSSTDLTPLTQFVNGWTGDLTLAKTMVAGATGAYSVGSQASPKLSLTVTRPGYDSSGSITTLNDTLYATSWLRKAVPNATLPTETQSGVNAVVSVTLNDLVYQSDTISAVTATAGLYTSGALVSKAATNIPKTNSSTAAYPRPICAWISEPGQRYDGTSTVSFEIFCGHAYGQGGSPVAAVKMYLTDGTHTVSHVTSTVAQSSRLLSTSCTATNGSNVLTGCSTTVGFIAGERLSIPGFPGQPKILSIDSSSQITLGVTDTCTPTVLGAETCAAAPGTGNSRGDGAFIGQNISDANLTTNPAKVIAPVGTCTATCTSATITLSAPTSGQWAVGQWVTNATCLPVGDYIKTLGTGAGGAGTYVLNAAPSVSCSGAGNITGSAIGANPAGSSVTTITISTTSAIGTTVSGTVTFRHDYQGSTGTVLVTAGNPVPVYKVDFSSSDFSTMTDGIITIRAQAFPIKGDVILDTQTGADGTQCDWFYPNVNGGVCNSSSAAWFATTGINVSPNLHNLWQYLDAAGNYAPVYAWVNGTGGGSPAVSTSSADPGGAAYYASVSAAVTAIKAYYNSNNVIHHNDLNGGVICLLAAGSPYAGFGGSISASGTANKAPFTITSVTSGAACPSRGMVGSDISVTLHNATAANITVPANLVVNINNLTLSDTAAVIQGADTTTSTTFTATQVVFNNDKMTAGAASPLIFRVGSWWLFNNLIDQSGFEGNVLRTFSTAGGAQVFGNTIVAGSYTANKASIWLYNAIGNVSSGLSVNSPAGLASAAYYIQPLSNVVAYNKFMNSFNANVIGGGTGGVSPLANLLEVNNVIECFSAGFTTAACHQISADSVTTPLRNVVWAYDTIIGGRANWNYNEGVAQSGSGVATGGALTNSSTAFVYATYSLVGNPTVETSTDGASASISIPAGAGTAGSISVLIPYNPNYVVNLYCGATNAPTNYAVVSGADAKALTGNQTVVITSCAGSSNTPITIGATTARNVLKSHFFQRSNILEQSNNKGDWYSGSGTNAASGGRVGNWASRWMVNSYGNVWVTGTVITPQAQGPTSGAGEVLGYLSYSSSGTTTDLSAVKYKSDRSYGALAATATSPALNLGQGNYCPDTSVTTAANRVPSGYAAWPFDIQGNSRKNDGTGWAGAYEGSLCQ